MTPKAIAAFLDTCPWPEGVVWAVSSPADPDTLWPVEARAVVRAVPERRAEFAGGRAAARMALTALGLPGQAVPMRADRSPVWPDGVVGSLTHAKSVCIAALARAATYRSLGVDLEPDLPLPSDLAPTICRPDEPSDLTRRRFSAKEAVFKALYPVTGVMFGFHGLFVDLETGAARLCETPETAALPKRFFKARFEVVQWYGAGAITSLCLLPPVLLTGSK